MGNTFKSLVAAAGILAAGDATNAQEGADSTANKTKQALVELLSELPPGFDSARKVIEGDITLAGDGDLSDSDKLAIEGHMGKLATVIPESARKVREAMTGVETIVVADVNIGPEKKAILPPIGQVKPKSIPLDLKGLDEGNNGWNVKGISKKGKITIEKAKGASKTRIVIEPREISDNYISITKGIDRQTQRGSSEVTIGCDVTIENLPGAHLYLQYAQVDPATKQWTGYQTVDFTENGKAFVKISGSGPIRFGLGVKGIPTNADGSIKEVPDAKIIITGLEIEEIKDTK